MRLAAFLLGSAGQSFVSGIGAEEVNKKAAMYYFRKSAELGNAQSQYNLAVGYLTGEGGEYNSAEAIRWRKMVEGNNEEKPAK